MIIKRFAATCWHRHTYYHKDNVVTKVFQNIKNNEKCVQSIFKMNTVKRRQLIITNCKQVKLIIINPETFSKNSDLRINFTCMDDASNISSYIKSSG